MLVHDVGVTYCIAMRLDEGPVFLSDTRTNAGIDNISTYRKLHVFRPADDRVFVLQSAGNLATTQEVLDRIEHDLATAQPGGLASVDRLYEAALHVGRLSTQVAASHRDSLNRVGADGTSSFILGVYRNGTLVLEQGRMMADSPSLAALGHAWLSHLVDGVRSLPAVAFDDLRREGPGPAEH